MAISTRRTQKFGFRVLFSTDRSQGSSEKWPIPVLRRSTLFAKKIRMCGRNGGTTVKKIQGPLEKHLLTKPRPI